jgi:hypothetical protein
MVRQDLLFAGETLGSAQDFPLHPKSVILSPAQDLLLAKKNAHPRQHFSPGNAGVILFP